jgi:hypothetical protein
MSPIYIYGNETKSFLATIKNDFVIDIACSDKDSAMISEEDQILKNLLILFVLRSGPRTWPCTLTGLDTRKSFGTC